MTQPKQTAREWLLDNMADYREAQQTQLITDCCNAVGCTRNNANRRLRLIRSGSSAATVNGQAKAKAAQTKAGTARITEADLLNANDPETRMTSALRAELAEIPAGEYLRDYEMRKACGASSNGALWIGVYQCGEFAPYAMEIGNHSSAVLYWGYPESVARLVEMGKARRPIWAK